MGNNKNNKNRKKIKKKNNNKSWIIKIIIWTILLSGSISFVTNVTLPRVDIVLAFIILIIIVLIGVTFDIIGVAVTAANEVPFHSMCSKKVDGAKIAVNLVRNADKVSNFCSDVIGDICGVVSGAIGALIVSKINIMISTTNGKYIIFISSLIGALIAALTIGGKAAGKSVAIKKGNDIVFKVAKVIYTIKKER